MSVRQRKVCSCGSSGLITGKNTTSHQIQVCIRHSTNRLQMVFMWIQTLGWIYTQSWQTKDALMSGSCLCGDVPCWWSVVQPLSPAPFFNKKVTVTSFWGGPNALWWQPGEAMLGSWVESLGASSWGTFNQISRLGQGPIFCTLIPLPRAPSPCSVLHRGNCSSGSLWANLHLGLS